MKLDGTKKRKIKLKKMNNNKKENKFEILFNNIYIDIIIVQHFTELNTLVLADWTNQSVFIVKADA